MIVEADSERRFQFNVFDTANTNDRLTVSGTLRILVARRYEAMEDAQRRAWTKLTFVVSRTELPEWSCETKYAYA